MRRVFRLAVSFLFLFYSHSVLSTILPINTDTLNYTQILFEINQHSGASIYRLEITDATERFDQSIIYKKDMKSLAYVVDYIFDFGKSYKWRYKALDNNAKVLYTSPEYKFYIKKSTWSDSSKLKQETVSFDFENSYKNLIVYDYGVIADKRGRVIWYHPETDGTFRSMQLNYDGKITYQANKNTYETDLKGKITWQGPFKINDGILLDNYHHDIKKLTNGNYLCLADKVNNDGNIYSVIFEINEQNKIQWLWDEEPIFKGRKDNVTSNHINALYYDEERNFLYTSARNTNTLTKINVKNGDMIYSIGVCTGKELRCYPHSFFSGQHALSITPDKRLLLFNNNSNNGGRQAGRSSVIEMKQPLPGDTLLTKTWEYEFNFEERDANVCAKAGEADMLPNGNILISSGANNRVFEVNRDKKIVWQTLSYKRDSSNQLWTPQSSFRVHYISSLYPNYFTVEKAPTKRSNQSDTLSIKINNDGSENDSYRVEVHSNNKLLSSSEDLNVGAGESLLYQLNPAVTKKIKDKIHVIIRSNTVKYKTREISF